VGRGTIPSFRLFFLALLFLALPLDDAVSQMHHHGAESIGVVSFQVPCAPALQAEFNRAMALLHHMTYPEARAAFRKIADADPRCTMAYWGMAMTLFQPVWPTRPGPAELKLGWELIQKAREIGGHNGRDSLLIDATADFFSNPSSSDYWKRIQAWESGMALAYRAYPGDDEVASLYALALVAAVPPDRISSPNNALAADILLKILDHNPFHPGAMHYLIHANDTPGRERESLDILNKYAAIAPHNPHALHMPTHIYTRLGDWQKVIEGNIKAAEAALEFPAGDHGQYVWDEFPHAIEYLVYARLQTGADSEAAAQIARLRSTPRLEPTFKTAFHVASTRARYALERKSWAEAAAIDPREPESINWDAFPWPEAIGWFARGLGSVHAGDTATGRTAVARLLQLEARSAASHEVLFERNIRVLRFDLTCWLREAEGLGDSAVAVMGEAEALENSTPKHAVTPGPTIPAGELLGDLLLARGKAADALMAYARSLKAYPARFNSYLGAARAARGANTREAAEHYFRLLLAMADPGSTREGLREAKEYLSR